ncbi:hypothetical protein CYMTET_15963 [Cymbomonas tetramitiformis]|uniref:Polycystin cation channel PKD1/PKD2 domain-containing protein n=1 Tax=Cymbomonas tetramitiformis TaxID=36881 RepID=A0AAE0GDE1_9CHLO|nr:hypothetical protein CYMTET_15963 [Cymbomonas tetramitiformis]
MTAGLCWAFGWIAHRSSAAQQVSHTDILRSAASQSVRNRGSRRFGDDGTGQVMEGGVYTACGPSSPFDAICDKGATATDPQDGDLVSYVTACSPDGESNKFEKRGLAGCEVDTGVPGVYNLTFAVVNSAGLSASVTRRLIVQALCAVGERLCSNGLDCSQGGICLGDLTKDDTEVAEPPNEPPVLTMQTSGPVTEWVSIKQYSEYNPCDTDKKPNEEFLCDPGLTAMDAEDGDLYREVLACPPECASSADCEGHEFWRKGLTGCLNTAADVGTIFNVEFRVYDHGIPALGATAYRRITITAACADGEYWCDGECSSVDCEARALLLAPPSPPSLLHRRLQATNSTDAPLTTAELQEEIERELAGLQATVETLRGDLEEVHLDVEMAGGNPEVWYEHLLGVWSGRLEAESFNQGNLSASLETAIANADMYLEAVKLINSALLATEAQLASVSAAQEAFISNTEAVTADFIGAMEQGNGDINDHLLPPPPPPPEGCEADLEPRTFTFSVPAFLEQGVLPPLPPPSPTTPSLPPEQVVEEADSARRQLLRASGGGGGGKGKGGASETSESPATSYEDSLSDDFGILTLEDDFKVPTYLANTHRLVGGMLLVLTRDEEADSTHCTDRFQVLRAPCRGKLHTEAPDGREALFGQDAVFDSNSHLYDAATVQEADLYYNTTATSGQVRLPEAPYFPYTFATRPSEAGLGDGEFPVWLDAGLMKDRATQMRLLMKEGYYLDKSTASLKATLATYQATVRTFTVQHMHFTWRQGGSIYTEYDSQTISVLADRTSWDWALQDAHCIAWGLAILWVHLHALYSCNADGRPLGAKAASVGWALVTSVQLQAAVLWLVMSLYSLSLDIPMEYAIYDDLYARANFLMPAKKGDTEMLPEASDAVDAASVPHWSLEDDNAGLERYLSMLQQLGTLQSLQSGFWFAQLFIAMSLVGGLLGALGFNRKMNFVVKTLMLCAEPLMIFFMVMFLISIQFAFAGHVLFGSKIEQWRNPGLACYYLLLFVVAGDWEAFSPIVHPAAEGWEVTPFDYLLCAVYVSLTVILMFMVLLNMLMCIIGDAQTVVKEGFLGSFKRAPNGLLAPDENGHFEAPGFFSDLCSTMRSCQDSKLDELIKQVSASAVNVSKYLGSHEPGEPISSNRKKRVVSEITDQPMQADDNFRDLLHLAHIELREALPCLQESRDSVVKGQAQLEAGGSTLDENANGCRSGHASSRRDRLPVVPLHVTETMLDQHTHVYEARRVLAAKRLEVQKQRCCKLLLLQSSELQRLQEKQERLTMNLQALLLHRNPAEPTAAQMPSQVRTSAQLAYDKLAYDKEVVSCTMIQLGHAVLKHSAVNPSVTTTSSAICSISLTSDCHAEIPSRI